MEDHRESDRRWRRGDSATSRSRRRCRLRYAYSGRSGAESKSARDSVGGSPLSIVAIESAVVESSDRICEKPNRSGSNALVKGDSRTHLRARCRRRRRARIRRSRARRCAPARNWREGAAAAPGAVPPVGARAPAIVSVRTHRPEERARPRQPEHVGRRSAVPTGVHLSEERRRKKRRRSHQKP